MTSKQKFSSHLILTLCACTVLAACGGDDTPPAAAVAPDDTTGSTPAPQNPIGTAPTPSPDPSPPPTPESSPPPPTGSPLPNNPRPTEPGNDPGSEPDTSPGQPPVSGPIPTEPDGDLPGEPPMAGPIPTEPDDGMPGEPPMDSDMPIPPDPDNEAPIAGSGPATQCLNRAIFEQQATVEMTAVSTSSIGTSTLQTSYDTRPNISTPFGTMTQFMGELAVTDEDGRTEDQIDFFIKLNGNIIEEYGFELDGGAGGTYELDTTDLRFDLGLGESRNTTVSTPFGQFEQTYTYLGQEQVTVPAGTFQACKWRVNSDLEWISVGSGLPVKVIQDDQTTIELSSGKIDGQSIVQ